ncbi:MAG: hypothetical protein LQ344_004910 [Seirophora lacunosa]|nr:MAG: hypothetical protein LQ344_004910 [Seirophora lacunosa]
MSVQTGRLTRYDDQGTKTKVRILAAIPRSGSTLFMRIFQEAPECIVTSRLVLMGNYSPVEDFRPDYTIFHSTASHKVYREAQAQGKAVLISKEELGHERWKKDLLTAYRSLCNAWSASHQSAIAITYEELISHPEQTLQRLCRHWDLPFSQDLLSFQHPFGHFLFSSERERQFYAVDNPLGLFNDV